MPHRFDALPTIAAFPDTRCNAISQRLRAFRDRGSAHTPVPDRTERHAVMALPVIKGT